jgi:hypothetical protein
MRKKKEIYVYQPYNLDDTTLRSIVTNTSTRNRVLLFYKILFNSYRKYNSKVDYQNYIGLHSDLINSIFGERESSTVINILKENGLIEVQPHIYNVSAVKSGIIQKSYTRSFRIPSDLLELDIFGKHKLYKKILIKDNKTHSAYENYRKMYVKRSVKQDDVLLRLAQASEDIYLDLSSEQAKKLMVDNNLTKRMNKQYKYTYHRYLHDINSRDIEWYKRDDYGRVHTAWVSLNKKCHSLIRFKGYEDDFIVEKDITNSQPFFSSIIDSDIIKRLVPQAYHLVSNIDFKTADWIEYKQLCLSGVFYEEWIVALKNSLGYNWIDVLTEEKQIVIDKNLARYEKIEKRNQKRILKGEQTTNNPKPSTKNKYLKASVREAAKLAFFKVIFGTQSTNCLATICFTERFKSVAKSFKIIKNIHCEANPSEKNKNGKGSYTNIAWLMQKIESEVMINTATRNLLDKGITQIVPRHDSILTVESLVDIVEQEIVNAFKQHNLPIPNIK